MAGEDFVPCASCDSLQPEGRKFCTECGASLAPSCANCGTLADLGAKFCGECGHPFAAVQPSESSSSVDDPGQQRFVTVLFADLVGFTSFSEGRDSEDVRAMLMRYFDRSRDAVERFGGIVDKYIGDAVMAVWGTEVAREDDAERGVRAALELVDTVRALGEQLAIPDLAARVGVLSGRTSVGGGGNELGLVVGDLVNTASRLQSLAPPGAVLVGSATRDLTASAIAYEALGEHAVKGKEEVVEAWRALHAVAGIGGQRKTQALEAPFVGREHDLRLLKELMHATTREGRARLVSVVGQAGIGKTRLAREFFNYVDGLTEDVYWHEGRSPAYGDGLTFWALSEMVRMRCGIAETDDDHRTRTRLLTALAEYVPDEEDRRWMEPKLLGLLGVGDVPSTDRDELFSAWRVFFENVAAVGTTVMIFEDFHWADTGLIDFVDVMAARSAHHPIMIVTLARPDLLERRAGWGSGRVNTVAMQLAPLANADMTDLVTGMLPGAPEGIVGEIVTKASGIPLYAVEFGRMLVSNGVLAAADTGYRVEEEVGDLAVPDSLMGVVGARIDQLEPADRALLGDASVLGQAFVLEGLAALRDEDTESLRTRLDGLVRSSLLELETDPRAPERGQYRFVQSLIREVAYSRLSKPERSQRHLAVAAYLERLDEPELAAAVAGQFVAALEASGAGADAAELAERAVSSLRGAAERAAALQSHEQAKSLADQALEMGGSPEDQGHLLVLKALSMHALGLDDAELPAEQAMEVFGRAGDERGQLVAATAATKVLAETLRPLAVVERLLPYLESLEPSDTTEYARAVTEVGRVMMLAGREREGLPWLERALETAEPIDDMWTIAEALNTKGTILAFVGRMREGQALLAESMRLAREHGLDRTYSRGLNNLSFILSSDDPRRVLELHREQAVLARRIGHPRVLAWAAGQIGSNLVFDGAFEEFDQLLETVPYDDLSRRDQIAIDEAQLFRRALLDPAGAESDFRKIVAEHEELGNLEDPQLSTGVAEATATFHLWNGRAQQAYEVGMAIEADTPNLEAASVGGRAALYLRDRKKLEAVLQRLTESSFRGGVRDAIASTLTAAIRFCDGDEEHAVAIFRDVADAVRENSYAFDAAEWLALIAHFVGIDHPLARELGRTVYDLVHDKGVPGAYPYLAHAMIPPEASLEESA